MGDVGLYGDVKSEYSCDESGKEIGSVCEGRDGERERRRV